jgi:transcriptional regulator GlxA family with amidase domain
MERSLRIAILVFDGVDLLDVTGPAAVFDAARERDPRVDYRLSLCAAVPGPVRTGSGVVLHADAGWRRAPPKLHTLVVPGAADLDAALADPALVAAIRRLAARAERVVSVCTGAFLLAAAGLLDGRRATTHWRHAGELARRFPTVRVEADAIFVRDGDVWTSAGVSAGMDLALALVQADHGPALALEAARALVLYVKRPGGQSQYSAPLQAQASDDPVVEKARRALFDRPGDRWTVERLAAHVHVSDRHLRRLFRDGPGLTPRDFIARTRMELAQRLLGDGDLTIAQIARRCGYGSAAAFDHRFEAAFGLSPTRWRQRFRAASPGRGR